MSFLVAMARARYHDNAFDAFTASSGYSPENARAMMWMSQLAYDTLPRWGSRRNPVHSQSRDAIHWATAAR